jgi:hypothetical protein
MKIAVNDCSRLVFEATRSRMLQCCNAAMLQCCNAAMLQCCNAAMLKIRGIAAARPDCYSDDNKKWFIGEMSA